MVVVGSDGGGSGETERKRERPHTHTERSQGRGVAGGGRECSGLGSVPATL